MDHSHSDEVNFVRSEIDSVNILISLPPLHIYTCTIDDFINNNTHDVVTQFNWMDGWMIVKVDEYEFYIDGLFYTIQNQKIDFLSKCTVCIENCGSS